MSLAVPTGLVSCVGKKSLGLRHDPDGYIATISKHGTRLSPVHREADVAEHVAPHGGTLSYQIVKGIPTDTTNHSTGYLGQSQARMRMGSVRRVSPVESLLHGFSPNGLLKQMPGMFGLRLLRRAGSP